MDSSRPPPDAPGAHGMASYSPDANPYAVPRAVGDVPATTPYSAGVLATRSERFGGAMIDGLLQLVVCIPVLVITYTTFTSPDGTPSVRPELIPLFGLLWFGLQIVQAVLITRRGQSVGKIVLRTRIVRMDGAPVGFVHGVLLRQWLVFIVSMIPKVGRVVSLGDHLYIFRDDHRCGHDLIAGTRVIKVES